MRSHALSCVLVIQTRHQVMWCLRFTSLSKQASKPKRKGGAKEKSISLYAVYAGYIFDGPGQ